VRVELAAGAEGITAYRHQIVRGSTGAFQSCIKIRVDAILQGGVMGHERIGHHVDG